MKIIAFIEDRQLIKKLLKHLGLLEIKNKASAQKKGPANPTGTIY
jgi:hypothetical protein